MDYNFSTTLGLIVILCICFISIICISSILIFIIKYFMAEEHIEIENENVNDIHNN